MAVLREHVLAMNISTALILLVALVVLATIGFGLFGRRHPAIGIVALLAVPVAALGGWYAWAETGSVPWTIGYGAVALGGAAAAARNLRSRSR